MREDLLDKAGTVGLAEEAGTASRRRISLDPRVWVGALALRGSAAAARRTMRDDPSAADRKSYLPRDLALSYFQAAHEEHTATGVKFAEGSGHGHGFDYHWLTGFLGELTAHIVRRIRFRLPTGGPRVVALGERARIVLVGDWGTGEGAALAVAAQMRRQIESAGDREVHVVHLGDVYYAGTKWEARHRFLDHWPVRPEESDRVRSWCLNGNHDMYAAGEGLFQVILADGRFARQRTVDGAPTSELHLRNDAWDVVGLDTSWQFRLRDVRGTDGHLGRRQQRDLAARLDGSARRRLLFSHHQPFTDNDDGKGVVPVGDLLAATAPVREGRGVDAWFWGHEHRLLTFSERSGVRYGCCMGHGAVLEEPAAATAKPAAGVDEFRATFRDSDGDVWRMPGFAVLDIDGAAASVRYLDMHGHQWREPDVLPGG